MMSSAVVKEAFEKNPQQQVAIKMIKKEKWPRRVRVKWVGDMHEQDRMTTQKNCELDVQHQDITQH